jgi:hypothetical protein
MTKPKKPMTRKGKPLQVLRDGHPRRMSDAKNAWRHMSADQRRRFVEWAQLAGLPAQT